MEVVTQIMAGLLDLSFGETTPLHCT
jgi:hypothetical protein